MHLPPFQQLLGDHGADVYRFLLAVAGPGEADDCYQETVLAALRAYPGLTDASNLRGWLLTIARRKAIDSHRARQRRPELRGELAETAAGVNAEQVADLDADPGLWRAVRRLPLGQRAALAHRYINDLRYADIAALLDCSEAAARQRVHTALDTLRKEWSSR